MSNFIASMMGFIYPAYRSFKALEKINKSEIIEQWLVYWIIFAFINAAESVVILFIDLPVIFYLFKIFLYLYLVDPKRNGA